MRNCGRKCKKAAPLLILVLIVVFVVGLLAFTMLWTVEEKKPQESTKWNTERPITTTEKPKIPRVIDKAEKEALASLRSRYFNVTECKDSEGNKQPAYWCSGIMLKYENFWDDRWYLNLKTQDTGAFSVAYLRKDIQRSSRSSLYDSGFIIYPQGSTPDEKIKSLVRCAFPIDGWTDQRSNNGCGKPEIILSGGEQCHLQINGTNTTDAWKQHYEAISVNPNIMQCVFNMSVPSAPDIFQTCLAANSFVKTNTSDFQSEDIQIMVGTWNESDPKRLPIEAFFYLHGSPDGFNHSHMYQTEFKFATGETKPIFGLQLPGEDVQEFDVYHWYHLPS